MKKGEAPEVALEFDRAIREKQLREHREQSREQLQH